MNFPRHLANHNRLHRASSGVWIKDDDAAFAYSDGEEAQSYIAQTIAQATDRGSLSTELASQIRDWPSEYHLSSLRSNLLRALNLDDRGPILEIGAGCGAITRYLGELKLDVDAVEGSYDRACIARLRCADLENVEVHAVNVNDLSLPDNHYGLVCFIGVLEYAQRFSGIEQPPEEAVLHLLAKAKQALRPGGAIVIAIENRLGFKYLFGAGEDHYGLAYEGIHDYPHFAGIKTYSKNTWEDLLSKYDLAYEFLYPFPDYKLPEQILSDHYVKKYPQSWSHVTTTPPRDYHGLLADPDTIPFWETVGQANRFGDFANSFLIVAAADNSSVRNIVSRDFIHISGLLRRAPYRTLTEKTRGTDTTKKQLLDPDVTKTRSEHLIHRVPLQEDFHGGLPLACHWEQRLRIEPSESVLFELISPYYAFIKKTLSDNRQPRQFLDLTPMNIMVSPDGHFIPFDMEWETRFDITRQFIFFRGLFYFFQTRSSLISLLAKDHPGLTLEALIARCFDQVGLDGIDQIEQFAEDEETVQKCVSDERQGLRTIDFLRQPLSLENQIVRLSWSALGDALDKNHSIAALISVGATRQKVLFNLPTTAPLPLQIRLYPSNRLGLLRLFSVHVFNNQRDQQHLVQTITGGHEIANAAKLHGLIFEGDLKHDIFTVTDKEPHLTWTIDTTTPTATNDTISIVVEMDWTRSTEFSFLTKVFSQQIDRAAAQLDTAAVQLDAATVQLDTTTVQLDTTTVQLDTTTVQLDTATAHLDAVHQTVLDQIDQINALEVHNRQLAHNAALMRNSRVMRSAQFIKNCFSLGSPQESLDSPQESLGSPQESLDVPQEIKPQGDEISADSSYIPEPEPILHSIRAKSVTSLHNPIPQARPTLAGCITTDDLTDTPLISVLMPTYNSHIPWLEEAINSVKTQSYNNWELCIVDDHSEHAHVTQHLNAHASPVIRVRHLEQKMNISGATNEALRMAKGDYVAFLDHDDVLTQDALLQVIHAVNTSRADIIYSDEDVIDENGNLTAPNFKPDYSPDLLLSHNYITHLVAVRRTLCEELNGLRSDFDGAQDYDLLLRLTDVPTRRIHHIPKILYHWRQSKESTSLNPHAKPHAEKRAKEALSETLTRRSIPGQVMGAGRPHFFEIVRTLQKNKRVTIVIPFKDTGPLLEACINAVIERTNYQHYEIIGISNNSLSPATFSLMKDLANHDSRIRFLEHNIPFNFSKLINFGIANSNSEYIVSLNSDIEIISWNWLNAFLQHAQRDEVAVVGGKLFYPNNTIQHAGIIVGINNYAGHSHKGRRSEDDGYYNRASLIQNVSAVTGAFMICRRTVLEELDGFDETFSTACNDVDFCLRARERGYLNIFTPQAQAYHIESATRGYEDTPEKVARFESEKKRFAERHSEILSNGDPYYNINLSVDTEQFEIAPILRAYYEKPQEHQPSNGRRLIPPA